MAPHHCDGDCSSCEGWIGDSEHVTFNTALGRSCACDEHCADEWRRRAGAIVDEIEANRAR